MPIELITFAAGLLGGLTRGLVGVSKEVLRDKKEFQPWRFISFIIISGIIGAIAGILVEDSYWVFSLLAGYAGSDFIDGVYKARFLKK